MNTKFLAGMVAAGLLGFGSIPASAGSTPNMVCKRMEVKMPSGFGSGPWDINRGTMSGLRLSMAEFQYAATKLQCPRTGPTASGYRIAVFYVVGRNARASARLSGCTPDGRKVFVSKPFQLPDPPSTLQLSARDIRVSGRCG